MSQYSISPMMQRSSAPLQSPRGSRTQRTSRDRLLYALVYSGRCALLVLMLLYLSLFHLQGGSGIYSASSSEPDSDTLNLIDTGHPQRDTINHHFAQTGMEQTTFADTSSALTESKLKNSSSFHSDNGISVLSTYDSSLHPVLDTGDFSLDKERPVHVRLIVGTPKDFLENHTIPVGSQCIFEGLGRSDFLKVTELSFVSDSGDIVTNYDATLEAPANIWIVDFSSLQRDCHALESMVQATIAERPPNGWHVVLIDSSGSSDVVNCPRLESLVPKKQIRLVKRSIVNRRHWDAEHEWVNPGGLVANKGNLFSGGPVLHMPCAVRENFVTVLRAISPKPLVNKTNPADFKRATDVAHFWRMGDHSHYTFLREKVSNVIHSMDKTETGGRRIHTLVDVLEEDEDALPTRYIAAMLSSKVVVVTQRDEWEDHYRLFEALASGAMVATDMMLGLPKGLEDRKSIVLYNSTESLKDVVRYYLDPKNDKERLGIARNGFNIAMGRHRCWHRMEEILFGKPLTMVGKPLGKPPKNALSKKRRKH